MLSTDRTTLRRVFFEAWRKHRAGEPVEPLEQMIAAVVEQHPEYHSLLEDPDKALERDYLPEGGESNPFLHLAMHLSLREQVSTDRPPGITPLFRRLSVRLGDAHETEHRMMECLGRMIWESQRFNRMPDEQAYLQCLRAIIGK